MDEMSGLRPEVVIDIKLSEIWSEMTALNSKLDSVKGSLHRALNLHKVRVGRTYEWPLTLGTAIAQVEENLPSMTAWNARDAQEALNTVQDIKDAITAKRIEAQPLEAEFEAKQWSRFFLVNNTNGHIHSSMNCSTCFYDTSFSWLPELSGLTERVAVEEHGEILCSVCFPSAPVEWTTGISKVAQAEKDARAAAKAERDAAKAAKAITNPDGTPLKGYGRYGGEIKTLVTAQRELVSTFKDRLYYGDEDGSRWEFAITLANAIGHKTGDAEIEEILWNAEKKANAAYAREQKA